MARARTTNPMIAEVRTEPSEAGLRPVTAPKPETGDERRPSPLRGLSWRARMGVVIPQLDLLTEPLLAQILPPGISFYVSRMRRTGPVNAETLHEMNKQFDSALTLLPIPYIDIVVYHCTMGSFFYDPAKLVGDIESRTGLPGVATLQAAMDALRHLGAKRISLVTPYPKTFNDLEARFLEAKGFPVVSVGGESFDDAGIMALVSPDDISRWVRRARTPETEAVFISCTGIRSLEFLDELEHDLGIPVVTSTSAMLWQVFRKLGINEKIGGLGRLLR